MEVISVLIAGLSFLIAGAALLYTHRVSRRSLFLALHEKLSSPEQIRGRRVLRERATGVLEAGALRSDSSTDDARLAFSALAMLDILALYVERKFVDKGLVLAEWDDVLKELLPHAEWISEERAGSKDVMWPHFQRLAKDAVARLSP